jgi:hypothetical protein
MHYIGALNAKIVLDWCAIAVSLPTVDWTFATLDAGPQQRAPTGRSDRNSTTVTVMLNTKFIDDLARQISDSIPAGVKGLQADVEKNVHTLLQGALGKLDLVTREDFDAQAAVLRRTREKLEALEKAIAELEKKITS